jgi:hypothetical protein
MFARLDKKIGYPHDSPSVKGRWTLETGQMGRDLDLDEPFCKLYSTKAVAKKQGSGFVKQPSEQSLLCLALMIRTGDVCQWPDSMHACMHACRRSITLFQGPGSSWREEVHVPPR